MSATAERSDRPPAAPPPADLRVRLDPHAIVLDDGCVLVGGSPSRLIRLRPAAVAAVTRWRTGAAVGADPSLRALARRLLDAGLLIPEPAAAAATGDLAVVVPVHGRVPQLERCLRAIARTAPDAALCVVDDGSSDADAGAIERLAAAHGAAVVRHPSSRGPAAARNTGLAHTERPLVAFVDSDVIVETGSLARLAGHFAEPSTGAAAPRILSADHGTGAIAGYEARHSRLDMGARPGRVRPGAPVPYVPAATLVVRRDAFGAGFDERLHVGEDVDLIWRLVGAGWGVWYDPAVSVRHEHRSSARGFAGRRFAYATSAGPLVRRHPSALPAVHLDPAGAVVLLTLLRRPWLAGALAAALAMRFHATLRDRVRRPLLPSVALAARSILRGGRGIAHAVRGPWWPLCALAALKRPRAALLLGGAWVVALAENRPARPSDAALTVADDLIAGAGTWWSCLRHRTVAPLLPSLDTKALAGLRRRA
jgi:mycofactocin system glycosyltransferase